MCQFLIGKVQHIYLNELIAKNIIESCQFLIGKVQPNLGG